MAVRPFRAFRSRHAHQGIPPTAWSCGLLCLFGVFGCAVDMAAQEGSVDVYVSADGRPAEGVCARAYLDNDIDTGVRPLTCASAGGVRCSEENRPGWYRCATQTSIGTNLAVWLPGFASERFGIRRQGLPAARMWHERCLRNRDSRLCVQHDGTRTIAPHVRLARRSGGGGAGGAGGSGGGGGGGSRRRGARACIYVESARANCYFECDADSCSSLSRVASLSAAQAAGWRMISETCP